MARRQDVSEVTNISDAAVAAKTGRNWRQWFSELDKAGADGWNHKTIAAHLRSGYGVDLWWSQTVTVAYERARGLRDKHEQADGFEIQVERTVNAPFEKVWPAMRDERPRLDWLPESKKAKLRSVREDKRHFVRFDWPGGTRVLMGCYAKGSGKCSAGVQQSKLGSAVEAAAAKKAWAERLAKLKALLES